MAERRSIYRVDAAKMMRKAVKHYFPGVKFYIRCESYAGGGTVHVDWMDGPSEAEVEEVLGPYESKGFDGMIDLAYHKDSWLHPDGFTVSYGRSFGTGGSGGLHTGYEFEKPCEGAELVSFYTGYVSFHREYSKEAVETVIEEVYAKTHIDRPEISESSWYVGYTDKGKSYSLNYRRDYDYSYRAYTEGLRDRSFYTKPADAKPEAKPAEEPAAPEETPADANVSHDRDWTWVSFPEEPSAEVKEAVSKLGGRWSWKRKAYYIREHIEADVVYTAIEAALDPAPEPESEPAPAESPEPNNEVTVTAAQLIELLKKYPPNTAVSGDVAEKLINSLVWSGGAAVAA